MGVYSIPMRPLWSSPLRAFFVTLEQLLTRIGSGDRGAFTDFYDMVIDRVFGTALRVLRNPAMAEEVAHDVMLEIWAKASNFDSDRGSAKAWIATITRRRAIDTVRSEEAGRNRDHRIGVTETPPPPDPVAEVVLDADEQSVLRSYVAELSDLQRESIEMAYYGGLTYAEVSEQLGVPLGTVKTRMRDGLKRLAVLVGPADG